MQQFLMKIPKDKRDWSETKLRSWFDGDAEAHSQEITRMEEHARLQGGNPSGPVSKKIRDRAEEQYSKTLQEYLPLLLKYDKKSIEPLRIWLQQNMTLDDPRTVQADRDEYRHFIKTQFAYRLSQFRNEKYDKWEEFWKETKIKFWWILINLIVSLGVALFAATATANKALLEFQQQKAPPPTSTRQP